MFAIRLINLIENHADRLSEGLLFKLQASPQCNELVAKVPAEELRRRTYEIYRNLDDWLLTKTEAEIEERYVGLGIRRARQGVPFSALLWAIGATKEYLWEYLQREGLMDAPLELFSELELVHCLDRFFDRVSYFAAMGYQCARLGDIESPARIHAVARR